MELKGRIEIGPYGGTSKSARQHQAFLVTESGERLQLRRYGGPSMRDTVLEEMDGLAVVADGVLRDRLFIAKRLAPAEDAGPTPASGAAPSGVGGSARRKS